MKKKNATVHRDVHPCGPHRELPAPVDEVKRHGLVEALIDWTIALIFVGLLFWLYFLNNWWTTALAKYGSFFLYTAGFVGAYAPWAFDDILDLEEERRLEMACLFMVFGIPLILVLGQQALCQPFELGAGPWPIWADVSSRVMVSTGALFGALFLVSAAARRSRNIGPPPLCIVLGLITALAAFFCLFVWPWLDGQIPIWGRAVTNMVLITIFIVASKTCPWAESDADQISQQSK